MEKELEQFYKMFEIKPNVYGCKKARECVTTTTGWTTKECISCKFFQPRQIVYPPITDTIILGLQKIITDHTFSYENMECRKVTINAPFGYIYKYGQYECHCGESSAHTIGKGKTMKLALINLCNLIAPEIKPQVQELFKGE
jgi:hypothetical protein